MFLMKAEADRRLNNNLTGGAALTVLAIASYLCSVFIADIISIFFDTLMIDFVLFGDYKINRFLGSLCGTAIVVLLISPFRLNLKLWYQKLDGEHFPLTGAFSYFKSGGEFFKAFSYSFFKFIIIFFCFLLPLVPAVVITAFLRTRLDTENQVWGVLVGTLVVIAVMLAILSFFYSLYIIIGFFLSDYLYGKYNVRSVLKAMSLSQKILSGQRIAVLKLIASMAPYYIFCLALFPIPFIVPKIQTRFAVFADKTIEKFNGGKQCQF